MSDREQEYWVAHMVIMGSDYPLTLRKVKAESRKEAAEAYMSGKGENITFVIVFENSTSWTVTSKREAFRTRRVLFLCWLSPFLLV